jgi:hypothetical protein
MLMEVLVDRLTNNVNPADKVKVRAGTPVTHAANNFKIASSTFNLLYNF